MTPVKQNSLTFTLRRIFLRWEASYIDGALSGDARIITLFAMLLRGTTGVW